MIWRRALAAGLVVWSTTAAWSQLLGSLDGKAKPKSYVSYVAEPQSIAAGKRATVELHFRVADGFHVNSHTPKSELLIPTQISFEPAGDVKAETPEYPQGTSYSFSSNPSEKLDVYTGLFTIRLPVAAAQGSHTVNGTLRYQACDHAACYPPKSLPVQVLLTAK